MRIFMQTKAAPNEAPRYYHLILQQDLLGGWSLLREWGQTGGRASMKREFFEQRDRRRKRDDGHARPAVAQGIPGHVLSGHRSAPAGSRL
jgi:predicted DNA-binding WGR domain protein